MSLIILIITGAIIGLIANMIVQTESRYGLLADIIIGIVGSILGKLIFFNLLGIGSAAAAGTLTWLGILWGVIGAVILIYIIRLFRWY